jgi:alpha-D-ribose 1-methylphosphonate 5-triphosphate synthase subunit PhnH
MSTTNAAYAGGFEQPVLDSQATFKVLMDCMARPGTIGNISAKAAPPAPMGPGSGAIAMTLCDHDTAVFLSPALRDAGVQSWFAFQTGALITTDREDAAFAFFEAGAILPPLSTFAAGTQEYPDRSTTIIFELASLEAGPTLVLSGPGVDGAVTIAPTGLPPQFDAMWTENSGLFPRGVDLVLVSGSRILCLPRSTRITRKEG